MKKCAKCNNSKSLDDFPADKRTKSGRQSWCRKCQNDFRTDKYNSDPKYRRATLDRAKKWYKNNSVVTKNGDLIRTFGITLAQYDELLTKQYGLCAICDKPETILDKRSGKLKSLAVDHDHITGKIRGLLCSQCNRSLGGFQDSPEILRSAIEYLVDI